MNNTNQHSLQFTHHYPDVLTKLKALPRTGWVQWNINNPETVWEHTLATRELAISYQKSLNLSDGELQDLLDIIEIHDWPEALVGDMVILGDEADADIVRQTKHASELTAMKEICTNSYASERILDLYTRYEYGSDTTAQLAKQLDKLQAVLKAAEYEKTQHKPGLVDEFIRYTKELIHDSFLVTELDRIQSSLQQ